MGSAATACIGALAVRQFAIAQRIAIAETWITSMRNELDHVARKVDAIYERIEKVETKLEGKIESSQQRVASAIDLLKDELRKGRTMDPRRNE